MRIIKNLLATLGGLALFAMLFMALSRQEITRNNVLPPGARPTSQPAAQPAVHASRPAAPAMAGSVRSTLETTIPDLLPPPGEEAVLPAPQSDAARLLRQYCGQCHSVPAPGLHTADQWPGVVTRMTWRAQILRNRMGIQPLSPAETARVVTYLQQYALKPVDPSRYPDLQQPDGQAFLATCGQCHTAPDPGAHPAAAWPAIVSRMRNYTNAMGKQPPDAAAVQQALAFLQRNSH